MEILDMKCAEYGSKIAAIKNNNETLITKSLGVLQEDGIYAFFLYLASRGSKEKHIAKEISEEAFAMLKDTGITSGEDVLVSLKDKANDLNALLITKELLERTLVYARYHAKALEKPEMEEAS